MGKRTLRTLHFDLVARVLHGRLEAVQNAAKWIGPNASTNAVTGTLVLLANDFADEFEIRAENFHREKFLRQCGLEGK